MVEEVLQLSPDLVEDLDELPNAKLFFQKLRGLNNYGWGTFCLGQKQNVVEPTVFFRIIAGDDYSREGDYSREVIISNITHWKSCPKFLFYFFFAIK